MTKDEIMEIALEAGIIPNELVRGRFVYFAELIAEAERDACAKACYEEANKHPIGLDSWWASTHCAQAIEARGQA